VRGPYRIWNKMENAQPLTNLQMDEYIVTTYPEYFVKKLQELFNVLDTDNDGMLDFSSFVTLGGILTGGTLSVRDAQEEMHTVKAYYRDSVINGDVFRELSFRGPLPEFSSDMWSDLLSWYEFFFYSDHLVSLPQEQFIEYMEDYIARAIRLDYKYPGTDVQKFASATDFT